MPQHYGGAPNAFMGGMEFGAAQRRRKVQENALNALIERFGPEAADPQALGQMVGIQQREELHPFVVRQAENAERDAESAHKQRAALNAAAYLESAARRGTDPAAAFDQVAQILPKLGIPAEALGQVREQFLADPKAVLDMLRSGSAENAGRLFQTFPVELEDGTYGMARMMADGSTTVVTDAEGNPIRPAREGLAADRNQLGRERIARSYLPSQEEGVQTFVDGEGNAWQRVAPGGPQEMKQDEKVTEQIATMRKTADGLRNAQNVAVQSLEEIKLLEGRLAKMSQDPGVLSTFWRGAKGNYVQGSNEWHVKDLMESISGRNVLQTLENVDSSLYPLSDKDSETLRTALGVLKVTSDPALIKANLARIKQVYASAAERAAANLPVAEQRIQTLNQRRSAAPAPAAAPTAPDSEIDDLLRMYGGQ